MTQESNDLFHRVLAAVRAELRACDEDKCHCPHVRMERRLARIRDRETEQERRNAEVFRLGEVPSPRKDEP